jgi:hypothetical protein
VATLSDTKCNKSQVSQLYDAAHQLQQESHARLLTGRRTTTKKHQATEIKVNKLHVICKQVNTVVLSAGEHSVTVTYFGH